MQEDTAKADAGESNVDPSGSGQNVNADAKADDEISDDEDDPADGLMYDKPLYTWAKSVIVMSSEDSALQAKRSVQEVPKAADRSTKWWGRLWCEALVIDGMYPNFTGTVLTSTEAETRMKKSETTWTVSSRSSQQTTANFTLVCTVSMV